MQEISFHQIKAGDTILMQTRFKDTHLTRVGTASYQPDPDTWLTPAGLAAASTDPDFTLYKLNLTDLESEPWTTLVKSPGRI